MTTKTAATTSQTATCREQGCGRTLRAAKSVAQGRGPVCQAKYEARIAQAAKTEPADRVAKAVELVEDGGVVRDGFLWLATSSDGNTRYEVNPGAGDHGTCTCTAGQYGRKCYHIVAAVLAGGEPVRPLAPVVLAQPEDPFANIPNAA